MQRRRLFTRALATVTTLIAVSLVGIGGPSSTAGAEPAAPQGLAADAAKLAGEWGVTAAEAERRLARQPEIGDLAARAAERWPDTFSGLWVDHHRGGQVVVAFTEDAARRVAELSHEFSEPGLLRPAPAVRAQRDLDALVTRMAADREEAAAGRLTFPGVEGGRYDVAADVRRNTVVVRVDRVEPGTQAAFASRYGGHVVVEEGGVMHTAACSITDCRSTLRSGLKVTLPAGYCSTAFTFSTGLTKWTSSAAHCGDWDRRHAGQLYGSVSNQQQSGRLDAELHSVDFNGFYAGPYQFVSSSEPARAIINSGTWSSLFVGAGHCKTGATTGNTCGTVTNTNVSLNYVPGSDHFVETTMCVIPGDSGSGVYSGNQAQGIVSGSTTPAGGTCQPSDRSVWGHIEYVLSTFGRPLMTSDTAPSLTSVNGASQGGSTINVVFTKPVRCSSVSSSDFQVTINNSVNYNVTSTACANDSDLLFALTVGTPFVGLTTVTVSVVGTIQDVGNRTVASASRSTTVSV